MVLISLFFFSISRETISRVTGGMKVKADRDEVGDYVIDTIN
jgi:ribosomal protein S11